LERNEENEKKTQTMYDSHFVLLFQTLPPAMKHKVSTIDVQPTGAGALVFVSGQILVIFARYFHVKKH